MSKSYVMHVLCWSHLDREWNQPFEVTAADMAELIDELLDIMERRREYRAFHLDGQVIPLEDYLELRPGNRARIEKLVRQGRLLIGPWYTLPEMNVVSGESIARNLLRGMNTAIAFGAAMRVGFTNTGWGQISQMPQIFNEFGIDTMTSYRGVPVHRIDKECLWEGADGSRVMLLRPARAPRSIFFMLVSGPAVPDGWRTDAERAAPPRMLPGARMASDPSPIGEPWFAEQDASRILTDHIPGKMKELRRLLTHDAATRHLWLGNWQDRRHPHPLLPEIIAEARRHIEPGDRIFVSTIPDYIDEVRKERGRLKVQLKGELRCPQKGEYGAELLSVLSARAPLKTAHRRAELLLIYGAELWESLAGFAGFKAQRPLLDRAWRLLFMNQCHDTIGGVGIDRVHQDQANRFARITDIAGHIRRLALSHLARRIEFEPEHDGESACIVFNSLPATRSGMIDCYLDVPAESAQPGLRITDDAGMDVLCEELGTEDIAGKVYVPYDCYKTRELRRYHVRFQASGIPGLGYKRYRVVPSSSRRTARREEPMESGRNRMRNEFAEVTFNANGTFNIRDLRLGRDFNGLGIYEDGGNIGSGWAFEPPERDVKIDSRRTTARIRALERGVLKTVFRIETRMRVPASASDDRKSRSRRLTTLKIFSDIALERGDPLVHVRVTVDNSARDHRLRVLFPTLRNVSGADAEMPFDVVRRPTGRLDTRGWTEHDDGTRPMLNFVDVGDGRTGMAFITEGLCEYELNSDTQRTLAITLIRSFAQRQFRWVNRSDPANFESQLPGQHSFSYAIHTHSGSWQKGRVPQAAYGKLVPMIPVQSFGAAHGLDAAGSFLALAPSTLLLSSVKRAETGSGTVVRVWNPARRRVKASLRVPGRAVSARICNMEEKPLGKAAISADGTVRFDVGPKKVVTVILD